MKETELIDIIKNNLIDIIPELEGVEIGIEEDLADLGANSIDRGELITLTLEQLELEVSRFEFAQAQTIKDLAQLMLKHF